LEVHTNKLSQTIDIFSLKLILQGNHVLVDQLLMQHDRGNQSGDRVRQTWNNNAGYSHHMSTLVIHTNRTTAGTYSNNIYANNSG